MRRKIQVWLLLLWFTGFEGAQVRDSWKRQERERIIKLVEEHQMSGETAGGFLGGCTCGEFIDDYRLHLIKLIKGEK
jgi:chorismate synthase